MVRVRIRFFSLYSDVVGDELVIELGGDASVKDVVESLLKNYPRLNELFDRVKPVVLVNGVRVNEDYVVRDGDEIAFIPPASGG